MLFKYIILRHLIYADIIIQLFSVIILEPELVQKPLDAWSWN